MAGVFPNLPEGSPVKAGFEHSIQIRAKVHRFRSGVEQRWAVSGLLNSFRLPYSGISWNSLQALRTFHVEQKGAFDHSWSITLLDPSTQVMRSYGGMAFSNDEFGYVERAFQRFDVSLEAVQTVAESIAGHAPGARVFPVIRGGVRVQLPFTTALHWSTERNDLPSGRRISRYVWPAPLRSWRLDYPAIDDDEVKTLVDFYLDQGGPVYEFDFYDPNTFVTHQNSRFSDMPLTITRLRQGVNRVTLGIEEFGGI